MSVPKTFEADDRFVPILNCNVVQLGELYGPDIVKLRLQGTNLLYTKLCRYWRVHRHKTEFRPHRAWLHVKSFGFKFLITKLHAMVFLAAESLNRSTNFFPYQGVKPWVFIVFNMGNKISKLSTKWGSHFRFLGCDRYDVQNKRTLNFWRDGSSSTFSRFFIVN